MTHLGDQISALVDGELSGAELDRANAHLAACERCRAEAAELRQLKRDLRALFEVDWRRRADQQAAGDERVPAGPCRRARTGASSTGAAGRKGPRDQRPRGRGGRGDVDAARSRGRYVVWSAVSLFVVGIGAAAFSWVAAVPPPAPKITPQLEMFSVEHAIVSGTVPDPEQTPAGASVTRP